MHATGMIIRARLQFGIKQVQDQHLSHGPEVHHAITKLRWRRVPNAPATEVCILTLRARLGFLA